MTFKKKKLSTDQKALKKALTKVAKDLKTKVRNAYPKVTGALRFGVDYKVKSKRNKSVAVVGVKSHYTKNVKGVEKIPNLYAGKVEEKYGVLEKYVTNQTVDQLHDEVAKIKAELLKEN